jgi:hypothetical protein
MIVRTAIGAALALCLASACSGENPSPDPDDPGRPGEEDEPDRAPGDDPVGGDPIARGLVRGGQLHQVDLPAPLGANADRAMLIGAVEDELRGRTGELPPENFRVRREFVSAAGGGAHLRHVDMVQTIGGVPVHGTYLQLTVREDAGAAAVVASSFRLYRNPEVDTAPTVTPEAAAGASRQSLRRGLQQQIAAQALEVRELNGRLDLVWATALRGSHERVLVVASGARAGRTVKIDERVYETGGSVTGFYVTGGAPGGLGVLTSAGVPNLDVTAPSGSTRTDASGDFALAVPDGETITVLLTGRAAEVFDFPGAPAGATGPAGPTLDLVLGSETSGEQELAQITAYVATDQTRSFVEANGVASDALGEPIAVNTNLPDVCNAYYSPFDRSINFFGSGDGCNNSATDSIVSHEYGHFVDDVLGGITDGGLSEGWGDLLSCYRLGVPELGFDLIPGEALRNCINDYLFPPGGEDEVHSLGQAWMGFAWLVREGLIARYGADDGDALARALVLPSLPSNAADILAAVREVFLRDDDDGDLSNQTPNWDVLYSAALHHGVTIAIETDVVPPAAVTDLAAASVGATRVTLAWTAPGDDASEGSAAIYEVRYSTAPITPENFSAATLVPGAPSPSPAGTPETLTVTVLPATTLFFAMISRDEQFNSSPLSNLLQVTTEEGTTIYQEGAEDGLHSYAATGLWHVTGRRAFEGVHSFWYGQEETGDYDTGDTNAGTLTSPVIDLGEAADPVLSFAQFVEVEEEDTFDLIGVIVADVDDPANTAVFGKDTGSTGGEFGFRVLPLAAFSGRRVQLTFFFDTVDPVLNFLEGWYIDDIRIVVDAEACSHDVCEAGAALDPGCSTCATTVCDVDAFCCEVFWDRVCVQEAETMCGDTCTGCSHDLCAQGEPLESTCDACAAIVCEDDPFCCSTSWDARCITESIQWCAQECAECTHDLCQAGGPLSTTCDPCVAAVCAEDAYCCATSWDDRCVAATADVCGLSCEGTR